MGDHLVDSSVSGISIVALKTGEEDETDSQDLAPNMPQSYRITAPSARSSGTNHDSMSTVSSSVFSYQRGTSFRSHDADVSVIGGSVDTDEDSSFMGSITSASRSIFSRTSGGASSRARASHPWERGGDDPLSTFHRSEQSARGQWASGSSVNTDHMSESNAGGSFAVRRKGRSADSLDLSNRSTQSRTHYSRTTSRTKGQDDHSEGFTFKNADHAQLHKRSQSHSPPHSEMYSTFSAILGFTSESDSETKYYRDSSDDDMPKKPATFTSLFRLQEEEVEDDFENHRVKEGIELSRKNNKSTRKTAYEVDNPRKSTMLVRPDVGVKGISTVGEGWRKAKIGQELEEHSDSGSQGDTSIDSLDQLLHPELVEDHPDRIVHINQESIASLELSVSRLDADLADLDSSQVIREEAEEQLNNLDHAEAVINTFNQILEQEEEAQLQLEIAMMESLPSLNSLGSVLEDLPSDYDEDANLALREYVADFMDTMDYTLNHPPQAKLTDLFRWSAKKNVDQVERTRLKRIEQEAARKGRRISSADALFQLIDENRSNDDGVDTSRSSGGGWIKLAGAMVRINNDGGMRRKSLEARTPPALQDQPTVNSKMAEGIDVRKAETEKEVTISENCVLEVKSRKPEAKPVTRIPERNSAPVAAKRRSSLKNGAKSKPDSIPVQEEISSFVEPPSVLNSDSAIRTTKKHEGSINHETNGKNLEHKASETPVGSMSTAREGVQLENTTASVVSAGGGATSAEVLRRYKDKPLRPRTGEDTQLENAPAWIAPNDLERHKAGSVRPKKHKGEHKRREKMPAFLIETDISTEGLDRLKSDPVRPRIRKGEDKRRENIPASIVTRQEGTLLEEDLGRHKSEPVRPRTRAAAGSRRIGAKRNGKRASGSSSENSLVASNSSSLRSISSSSRGPDLDDAKKPAPGKEANMVNGTKIIATGSHRRSKRGPEAAPQKLKPDLVTAFNKSSSSFRRADVESRGTEPVAAFIVKDKESKNESKEELPSSISPEEVLVALMGGSLSKAPGSKTKIGSPLSMVDSETSMPSPSAQFSDPITKKRKKKTRIERTTALESQASRVSSRANSPPHAAISASATTPREIEAAVEHRSTKRSSGVRQSTSLKREGSPESRASRVSSRDSKACRTAVSFSTTIGRGKGVSVEIRASQRVNDTKQSSSAEREVSAKSGRSRVVSSAVRATKAAGAYISLEPRSSGRSTDREVSSEIKSSRVPVRGDNRSHPVISLTKTGGSEELVQPQAAQRINDATLPNASPSSRVRSERARRSTRNTTSPPQVTSAELPQKNSSKLKKSSTNNITPNVARRSKRHTSSAAIPSQKGRSAKSSDSVEMSSGSKASSSRQSRSSKSGASRTRTRVSSRLSQSLHDGSGRSRRSMMDKGTRSDDDDSIDISKPVFRKAPSRQRRLSTKSIEAPPTSWGNQTTTASTETGGRRTGETLESKPSHSSSPAQPRGAEKKARSRRDGSLPSSTSLSASGKKAASTQSSDRKSRGRRLNPLPPNVTAPKKKRSIVLTTTVPERQSSRDTVEISKEKRKKRSSTAVV